MDSTTASTSVLGKLPETGFLRLNQIIPVIVPFSAATVWRKVQSGDFPKPVKLSTRVTAWRAEDIREWVESRR